MTTQPDAVDLVRGPGELGAVIRKARLRLGLSQAELARDAQVGRQWLVGLEAGDKPQAPLMMILQLLRELDLAITLQPPPVEPAAPETIVYASDILRRYTREVE